MRQTLIILSTIYTLTACQEPQKSLDGNIQNTQRKTDTLIISDKDNIAPPDSRLTENQSDTLTYIKAWGIEPSWTFELLDSSALFGYYDRDLSLKLIQ